MKEESIILPGLPSAKIHNNRVDQSAFTAIPFPSERTIEKAEAGKLAKAIVKGSKTVQHIKRKKDVRKAYIALAIVSFFWGTTYLASKLGAQHMPGLFVSGMRQLIAGSLLVSFFLARGYRLPEWKVFKKISIQAFFLLCIANGLLTWSLQYISSGLAAIIAGLVPVFIALFSVLLYKTAKFTKWMMTGLAVGFGGILIIFYDYLKQLTNPAFLFGLVLTLISVLSWSFGTVYTAKNKVPLNMLFIVGLQMLIAGIIILPLCLLSGQYINPMKITAASWYAVLYLVFFGSLLAYSAYVFAISKLPATLVSVYAYINPIVAVGLGWLVLQEKMNTHMILGTFITLGGIYLVNREYKKLQV